jgi:lipopolysaccharide transport protein LptA
VWYAVLAGLIILAAAGRADAAPRNVDVRSTSLQIQEKTGEIRFEGSVEVRMSGVVLTCDLLTVKADPADPSKIVSGRASGNVVLTREGDRVTADEAVFDLETETVELSGVPRLIREDTTIEAEGIVYSLAEGTTSFKGPVRALFRGGGD